jgi:SAM-dependent methyltransferase
MDPAIARQLIQLNRDFYDQMASPFAASRTAPLPGVERLLAHVPADSALLDVGCGGGQLAVALDRLERRVCYIGVDASLPLIEQARQITAGLPNTQVEFLVQDVTAPGWLDALPGHPYQTIAALALLHHIPGAAHRVDLLHALGASLAPGGCLLISTWQFLNSPRLRHRQQPWSRIGLQPDDLEPGDYLLDWQRAGYGLRYCASIDQVALAHLAAAAGLEVIESFHAGRDNLNLCAALRQAVA